MDPNFQEEINKIIGLDAAQNDNFDNQISPEPTNKTVAHKWEDLKDGELRSAEKRLKR